MAADAYRRLYKAYNQNKPNNDIKTVFKCLIKAIVLIKHLNTIFMPSLGAEEMVGGMLRHQGGEMPVKDQMDSQKRQTKLVPQRINS